MHCIPNSWSALMAASFTEEKSTFAKYCNCETAESAYSVLIIIIIYSVHLSLAFNCPKAVHAPIRTD